MIRFDGGAVRTLAAAVAAACLMACAQTPADVEKQEELAGAEKAGQRGGSMDPVPIQTTK